MGTRVRQVRYAGVKLVMQMPSATENWEPN